jgi:uncharacterized membrane protein (DUF485 family)
MYDDIVSLKTYYVRNVPRNLTGSECTCLHSGATAFAPVAGATLSEKERGRRSALDHGPATEWKTEKSEAFKSRLGLIMIGVYVPVYMIFIMISVLSPKSLGMDVGGLNLAIAYGFGLIVLAIIQALIYNYICSKREKRDAEGATEGVAE